MLVSGFERMALSAVLGSVLASGVFAASASAADVAHGEQLARRWCASCHVVADDQTHGSDNVPTFTAVARSPGFTTDHLARFLRDPHPKMPDMQLSVPEADDLAAYIASLAK